MPYKVKGKCVYKKEDGSKVGCTKGSVNNYLAALHANANESIKEENKLIGGKSDKLSINDIANKFGVSPSSIQNQINKGIKVELEHTKDKEKALEIAMDHLTEIPDYYDRLSNLENKAFKELKQKNITENSKSFIKQLIRENLGF